MRSILMTLAVSLALTGAALKASAQTGGDAPGAADHPVLKRFEGSALVGYGQQDWATRALPGADGFANKRFVNPLQVEGKLTRLFYLAPLGKTPLEVFRNHQQALMAAGFKPRYLCDGPARTCAGAFWALDKDERGQGMAWTRDKLRATTGGATWDVKMALDSDEVRLISGSLERGGQVLHLLLFTSFAATDKTHTAATYLEIIEPRAMPTGQVSVDAQALSQGLQAEGKIALYGLYFDTGRAEIKPESAGQLAEMVKALQQQPTLKVFIVGHTDNVGGLEANLALSLARAQAVVAALIKAGIDGKRLHARGVASLAPVAANTGEDGRAKNRRVELVAQ